MVEKTIGFNVTHINFNCPELYILLTRTINFEIMGRNEQVILDSIIAILQAEFSPTKLAALSTNAAPAIILQIWALFQSPNAASRALML